MSEKSSIHWTDATWNPVTGCTKISPGCKHCYAERVALKMQKRGFPAYRNGFEVTIHPERADLPLKWMEPRMVFVNSMSDLFHEKLPDSYIANIFEIMRKASQHTFQVLTKRAARLGEWPGPWPANVWPGVSVEDQPRAMERIDHLLKVVANVHWLSCEPLLGPLDLRRWLPRLQWVVVGGESGPNYREMRPEWARSIRDQCQTANVPFFFKQGNGLYPGTGRELDGRLWEEYPDGR